MDESLEMRRYVFICLCLVAITASVYWQVLNHNFVYYDDNVYVTENYHVQSGLTLEGVIWSFTTNHASNWHPLTWLSHMLDCGLYGLKPRGHHLTNLLFHIVNSLLLLVVLRRMTGALWRSAFVAAMFALHPLHVESVAWVAERKDVLSTFFWMTTMWAYVRYVRSPGFRGYLLVLILFALGLAAKPMLVTLPFVLLLMDYWPLQRFQFGSGELQPQKSINPGHPISPLLHLVREKAPFFVLAALSSAVTIVAQQSGGALTPVDKLAFGARITNALVSYASYIGKMLWPFHLAVVYPHPGKVVIWQAAGAAFILVCISILVIRAARRHPYFAVGWLWYLGTLVPVIGVVQVGKQAMADRYTYVPLIGLFMIIAWGAADLTARWRSYRLGLATSAGVLVIALATCTWFQVGYWQNGAVLFEHALHVTSKNYLAHNNLGVALARQGRFDEAVAHLAKALEIRPKYAWAHNNLGAVLARQANLNEAIAHFSEALRIDPKLAEADISLGIALASQGHLHEALSHFLKALGKRPDSVEVHNNLGVTLARLDRFHEAAAHFSKVLEIMPDNAEVRHNLRRASKEAQRQKETPGAPRSR